MWWYVFCAFGVICAYVYCTASPAHRLERLNLHIYVGAIYAKMPFSISRAYDPMISLLQCRYIGLCAECVYVLVRTNDGHLCIGHRSKPGGGKALLRYPRWNTDVGACGMVCAGETPFQAATRELYEELGLHEAPRHAHIRGPYHGHTAILHVFEVVLPAPIPLKSLDGTFTHIEWAKDLREYMAVKPGRVFNRNVHRLLQDRIL